MKLKNIKRLYKVNFVVKDKESKDNSGIIFWIPSSIWGANLLASDIDEATALATENIDKLIELAKIPETKEVLRIAQISEDTSEVLC